MASTIICLLRLGVLDALLELQQDCATPLESGDRWDELSAVAELASRADNRACCDLDDPAPAVMIDRLQEETFWSAEVRASRPVDVQPPTLSGEVSTRRLWLIATVIQGFL